MDVEFFKYQYEKKVDEDAIVYSSFRIGIRHLQVIYMFFMSVCMGILRGSIGVSMMAITDETRLNDTYIKVQNWDRSVQGIFLFSFFFGYAVMLAPAEIWLRRICGKYLLTGVLLINGALCSAIPTIINKGSHFAVFSAFLILGMTQTGLSPANQTLLQKWLPPNERNNMSWLIYGGVHIGIAIGISLSGVLSEADLGWELIFYSLAMMAFSMAVIWFTLTASSPAKHEAVGIREKEFIESGVTENKNTNREIPWWQILRSKQFWAIASAHVFSNVAFIFCLTDVPVYLKMYNLTLRESTCIAVIPILTVWVVYMILKPIVQLTVVICVAHPYSNILCHGRANPRKIINFVSASGIVTILPILYLLIPDMLISGVILLAIISAFLGLQFYGFVGNISDITENFSAEILMMSSGFASIVGAFYPLVSGFILRDEVANVYRWKHLLLFVATLCVVCNMMFIKLARNYRLDFERVTEKRVNNSVYTPIEMELISDV